MKVNLYLFSSLLIVNVYGNPLELSNGLIKGNVGKTKKGRLFQQFYGIPYARPPIGELRFKVPKPVESWTNVKDASKPPPKCIQHERMFDFRSPIIGQEDCLYINVFVPNDLFNASNKTPVIVGIHGGGFLSGAGTDYSPDYFMDHDVVFVTFNYRLGPLGFLGLNNDQMSGNFGLKDQSLALQWVKQNIARFGGDPDRVTLIGESAGATSVHLHMFSPLSKGLFQRAIMQSGSAFNDLIHYQEGYSEAMATAVLLILGCFHKDTAKILACLQRVPAEDIIKKGDILASHIKNDLLYASIVESKVNNQPFLPQKPSKTTYQTRVPWITGINSCEGCLFAFHLFREVENKDTKLFMSSVYQYLPRDVLFNTDNATEKVIDYYFNTNDTKSHTRMMLKFIDMMTDFKFLYPMIKTVQSSRDRQYAYFYDHKGSFSWPSSTNLTKYLGPGHAEELHLLFRDEKSEAKWTPEDKRISETLVRFWTNFATFTDPNGPSGEKIWTPVATDDVEYLHIKSDSLTMEKKKLKERSNFWQSLSIEQNN